MRFEKERRGDGGSWVFVALLVLILVAVLDAKYPQIGQRLFPSSSSVASGADGFTQTMRATTPADALAPTQPVEVLSWETLFNGTTWDRRRAPNVFKQVALGAGTTETTIWTPTTGKKFRLLGFILTTGAASTLTFKDNTGGTTILTTRPATDPLVIPAGALGNGLLSAAANNVLTVTRGTSTTLDGTIFGTEE